jgi:protein O-GlcNAc transferase
VDIRKAFQSARQNYLSGNFSEAERIYRKILKIQPDNAGVYYELGTVLEARGSLDEAIINYKRAADIDPQFPGSYNNLGNILRKKGQLSESIDYYRKAVELAPDFAGSHYNLAQTLHESGHIEEAVKYYRKAIQINPDLGNAHYNLGNALRDIGQYEEAIDSYRKALQINTDNVDAYNNLGNVLKDTGSPEEAMSCYYKALQIDPAVADTYGNLGSVFIDQGKLSEAESCYQKMLEIDQNDTYAYNNLGITLQKKGQLDEAQKYFREALKINRDSPLCYSNLLLTMNYSLGHDPSAIFAEHLKFGKLYDDLFPSAIVTHRNDCSGERRLRVGYVSPDFRRHSVAYFIGPVLSAHNRDKIEVFCYSDVKVPDELTGRIRGDADRWRSIVGMSDEQVAGAIRGDNIDILIDLAGHTASNRMLLFARKPAPVQVSWIGYPATTGLSAMDYKIVDNYTDPPGMTEQFYTERLIRMPDSFLCYLPEADSPEVGNLPSLETGNVSFCSFNNFPKMTPEVIGVWIKILKAVPGSHLVLKAKSLSDEETREHALDVFTREGIERHRLRLLSWLPSTREHLNLYNQVDIALDTFPYNGTTTTCEALWMGVPVVTLAGDTHASRVGVSLLSNVGLKEFIAHTSEEYVETAVTLAKDRRRLQYLRLNLRDIMGQSPLTNAREFTLHLEDRYRTIWETWCKAH